MGWESTSCLQTVGQFQAEEQSSGVVGVGGGVGGSCCRADSRLPLQPSPCQHILQRSCVPAVEHSAELEVRSPAAGWGRPQQGGAVRGG